MWLKWQNGEKLSKTVTDKQQTREAGACSRKRIGRYSERKRGKPDQGSRLAGGSAGKWEATRLGEDSVKIKCLANAESML